MRFMGSHSLHIDLLTSHEPADCSDGPPVFPAPKKPHRPQPGSQPHGLTEGLASLRDAIVWWNASPVVSSLRSSTTG